MNFDMEKLTKHIRKKLKATDPLFEDVYWISDSQIEQVITATMDILKNKSANCCYCQNFKKFGFSKCKIRQHIQNDCFYYTPDIYRLLKKNDLDITFRARIRHDFKTGNVMPPDVEKKIIYESIKLFDLIKTYEVIK